MPWKETGAVEERLKLVMAVEEGESVAEAARCFGVSRVTAYKWLARYAADGLPGLQDRWRAPVCHPQAVAEDLRERIVRLRYDHPTWGPVKHRHWLVAHEPGPPWPAPSTIGALLKERGLTTPRKRRHIQPYGQPLAHCQAPNRVWSADFKGWFRTGDGCRCEPLTISDGHTRYLLRCQNLTRTTRAAVQPLFEATFRAYGLPLAIRTDNGVPFAATKGLGLSSLAVWWIKLGITPERIRPGNPQENGRHERLHRTLKAETLCPPAATLRGQQRRFDRFREEYNQHRPHQALGHRTPASCYEPSPRPYPARLAAPDYPAGWTVRRVYERGWFYWEGQHWFLSTALANERIALAPGPGEDHRTIYFGHVTLAYLDQRRGRIHTNPPKITEDV